MAEIIYPSAAEYEGPWLIEFPKLVELDKVADEIVQGMLAASQGELQGELRELQAEFEKTEVEYKEHPELKARAQNFLKTRENSINERYKAERKLTVRLGSGKRVEGKTFQEIAKEPITQNEVCRHFSLSLTARRAACELILGQYSDDKLQYSVKPASDSMTKDIVYDLESWISSVQSASWLKVWNRVKQFVWIAYLPILMILFSPDFFLSTRCIRE